MSPTPWEQVDVGFEERLHANPQIELIALMGFKVFDRIFVLKIMLHCIIS